MISQAHCVDTQTATVSSTTMIVCRRLYRAGMNFLKYVSSQFSRSETAVRGLLVAVMSSVGTTAFSSSLD